ncbi:MAG: dockerin type I domain-containing protein [Chthoniobacterales bacterium]
MKIKSKLSAFAHPRLLLAATLGVFAIFLMASAFTGFGRPIPGMEENAAPASKAAPAKSSKKKEDRKSNRRATAAKVTVNPRSRAAKIRVGGGTGGSGKDQSGPTPTVTESQNSAGQTVYTVVSSGFDVSKPLREMATSLPESAVGGGVNEREEYPLPAWRIPRSDERDPVTQVVPSGDSATRGPGIAAPSIGFNFAGMIGAGSYPPDNNGSVGNDQYVETVNTRYQVWTLNRANNTVTSLVGPSNINTLWTGFAGGNCAARNDGDPVVLFDKIAQRWVITQFTSASPYNQCVAISTTADASGTYYRYAFAVPSNNFGDYPHYGVWTDAYYVMFHQFTSASGGSYVGGSFGAMDRTKMLAGDPAATWQVIVDPTEGGHMPADIDGNTPPPGGAPGIFLSLHGSSMFLYRMKVDFATPANTVRTLQGTMPIAPSSAACNGGNCIPQPGSTATIDSLADRLMFRVAYRNFVDHESLVVSHSVDPGITGVLSAVRWYDFRISGQIDAVCSSYPCTYQQGSVADVANGRSRWMPSLSMDGAENILVGYSTTGKTNGTENHSVRYTGRAKDDPLGTMTVPEATIVTGTRNVTNGANTPGRWGDYTSMVMDPSDDCTFWYVNEFYATGNSGNGNWKTQVASSRFPAGSGIGQCQAATCTSRPISAPTIGSASATGNNQVTVTWTGIAPMPGSYAVERAVGAPGSEGLYRPVDFVSGASTNFVDTTVQGGVTYTYRVIAAADGAGRCQALVRSGTASATATGNCSLKPTFAGATSATSTNGASCGVSISWTPATTNCPLSTNLRYNIYRGTVPDVVPSAANRIATCVPGPSSYVDSNNLTSGNTYYYVVRAEDNTTGNGGPCGGGNEDTNSVVVAGTAYGVGTQANPGTYTDGGGDATAFLQLNSNGSGQVWRFVKTSDDAGANHTPGGSYAYRTAGPGASALYASNACSTAETPTLTVGGTTINLTYWERHQLEQGWDGIAVEYSRNAGAWTSVPVPTNLPASGCLTTDVITDWSALTCTGSPPANACGDPITTQVITGPVGSGTSCTNWVTGALTAYGRRCHFLTGLTAGDTIKFRWRMISDSSAEFAGFYLDDIAVTNVLLPNPCTGVQAPAAVSAESIMTHGAAGTFGINLPLGGRGIEPRLGAGSGAARDYMIVVHFDRPVDGGSASLTGSGAVGSVSFSGSDMTIPLTGVTDQQTVTLTLNNVTSPGGGTLSSTGLQIGFLAGDVNGNGSVTSSDIAFVKSVSGTPVTGSTFQADVIVNGSINSSDVGFVKTRSGATLPP